MMHNVVVEALRIEEDMVTVVIVLQQFGGELSLVLCCTTSVILWSLLRTQRNLACRCHCPKSLRKCCYEFRHSERGMR